MQYDNLATTNHGTSHTDDIAIFDIRINFLNYCNLACSYCFALCNGNQKHEYMSTQTIHNLIPFIQSIIEAFPQYKFRITLYGGEPLINLSVLRDIFETIKIIFSSIFNKLDVIVVVTNGTIVTSAVQELLSMYKFVFGTKLVLAISVDGYPDNHNYYRRDKQNNPTFNKIYTNIPIFQKIGIPITLQCVLSYYILKHSKEFISFIQKDPLFQTLKIHLLTLTNMYFEDISDIEIRDAFVEFNRTIVENFDLVKRRTISFNQYASCIYSSTLPDSKLVRRSYCQAGSNMISILHNGDIYPCEKMYYDKLYTLCYGNINIIKNLDVFLENRSFYSKLTSPLFSGCHTCEHGMLFGKGCIGGCISEYIDNPNIKKISSEKCIYNKYYKELMVKLHGLIYNQSEDTNCG